MKWISVKDIPGADDLRVLTCDCFGYVQIGVYQDGLWYEDVGCERIHNVIAWSLLPRGPSTQGQITNDDCVPSLMRNMK